MIRQTILPFKVEMTRDMITPHAGLALLVGKYRHCRIVESLSVQIVVITKSGV